MKYTPSALVSEFSGKQGSTVASHNRYGPYFRNRTIPTNPNTVAQQDARNNLVYCTRAWSNNLLPSERAAFDAAAPSVSLVDALGRTYTPTGQNYFVSLSRNKSNYSGINIYASEVPATPDPTALETFTVTADIGLASMSAAYTTTPAPAATKVVIEATRQVNPGVTFMSRSEYRQIFMTAAAAASPADILAAYEAKFGAMIANKQIFFRAYLLNSVGQRSGYTSTTAIVAP